MESSRAQVRSQLLASENGLSDYSEVNTMSGFASHGRMQHPGIPPQMQYQNAQAINDQQMGGQPNFGYSNHDLVTPVLQNAANSSVPSSRKTSMNSSSMQRFFRRKGNQGGHFDEDTGADINELPSAAMSFNDITHLRGSGRYNTSAYGNLDTAPIIPVMGMAGSGGAKSLNNVQYRKFMNHQKKLNLAQSARAMSLAGGGNPMAEQDPRSMSFTNAPNSRNNSLGNPMNGMGTPNSRAMSLNSNAMFGGKPNTAYGYGPGQRPQQSMNGQGMFQYNQGSQMPQMQHGSPYMGRPIHQASSPKPNTQMHGAASPQFSHQGMNQMHLRSGAPQTFRGTPQGPRANSLSGNGMPMSHNQMGPYGQRTQSMTNGLGFAPAQQRAPNGQMFGTPRDTFQQGQISQHQIPGAEQYAQPPRSLAPPKIEASTESLMNVMEEEEDEDRSKAKPEGKSTDSLKFGVSANTSLPLSGPNSDDDHVYKFDDHDSPQVSRKSTVKKSNSMRVRKLDLFSTHSKSAEPEAVDKRQSKTPTNDTSVSFRMRSSGDLFDISDDASNNNDNSDSSGLMPGINTNTSPTGSGISEAAPDASEESSPANSQKNQRPLKLKSLTQNTAFSKFRITSSSSQTTPSIISNVEGVSIKSPSADQTARKGSDSPEELPDLGAGSTSSEAAESQSRSSAYSAETSKNPETNPTRDSIISEKSQLGVQEVIDGKESHAHDNDRPVSRSKSRGSTGLSDIDSTKRFSFPTAVLNRDSSISRSNSELKMKGLVPSSALLRADTSDSIATRDPDLEKKEKRKSMSSMTSRSKSLIKRLSFSSSKRTVTEDVEGGGQSSGRNRISSAGSRASPKPLSFTKEELAVLTCNNELQSELQLVTSELALSIKRELSLEAQMRSRSGASDIAEAKKAVAREELEKAKIIVELQEKLNQERKLRFISEEHAILSEHGQSPSALKLDYEKNEIYNQLLAKSDMVIQLQDRLDEALTANAVNTEDNLVLRFNELLKENSELKSRLETKADANSLSLRDGDHAEMDSEEFYHEYDQALIMSLKTQRDELREMITKLTSSRDVELKVAHEKIKTLEAKLEKVNSINYKLSKRVESAQSSTGPRFPSGQGGKLQGFSIVSPSKKLFDD
ncbi:hypothetical protein OXX59_001458 [Metschnikowia pulcherrima]